MTEFERGMLAGLVIGEGTITLSSMGKKGFRPEVKLSNTDPRIIQWIDELLTRCGIKHFCSVMKTRRLQKPTHRLQYMISIWGLAATHRLLKDLRPALFVKGEQADLVLGFIALRLSALKTHGRFGNPPRQGEAEDAIVGKIRFLNKRGA